MKKCLLAGAALATALALHPAPVFATAKIYDMTPLIYEPHPFQPVVPPRYRPAEAPPSVATTIPVSGTAQPSAATAATTTPPSPAPAPELSPPFPPASPAAGLPEPPRRTAPQMAETGLVRQRDDSARAMTSAPSYLFGQPGHYYATGALGLAFLSEASNKSNLLDINSNYQVGFTLGAAGGFRFGNGIRGEVEIAYRRFALDTLTVRRVGNISGLNIGTSDVTGSASALAFMANVAYELDRYSQIVPYVMAGLGPARVSADGIEAAGVKVASDSAWVMAFQLGVGATYPIDSRWSVGGDYRWFWTTNPTLTDAAGDKFDSEFSSHNFTLFARYTY